MSNIKSWQPNEFELKVVTSIARGKYGVKVRNYGSVLLDVCGYMQQDGSIGPHPDPSFRWADHLDHIVLTE